MGSCPFCNAKVSQELILFGGACPRCFIDIAGEEEPTDPGIEQQQEMIDEAHAQQVKSDRRQQGVVVIMLLMLVAGAGLAWQQFQAPDIVTTLDSTVLNQFTADDVAPADLVASQETVADASIGDDGGASSPSIRTVSVAPSKSGSATRSVRHQDFGALDDEASAPDIASLSVKSGSSLMGGLDLSVTRKEEKGITLTTDDQIMTMVGRVLDSQTPRLRSCYERRLKVLPDLKGVWTVALTILKDGSVDTVSITGLDLADSVLEDCVVSKVNKWSFQPIAKVLEINKIVSFNPRY